MNTLEVKERIKLENHKDKIANLIGMWSGGTFMVLFIICFIPMGLIPSKRSIRVANPDQSIFESLGGVSTILLIACLLYTSPSPRD